MRESRLSRVQKRIIMIGNKYSSYLKKNFWHATRSFRLVLVGPLLLLFLLFLLLLSCSVAFRHLHLFLPLPLSCSSTTSLIFLFLSSCSTYSFPFFPPSSFFFFLHFLSFCHPLVPHFFLPPPFLSSYSFPSSPFSSRNLPFSSILPLPFHSILLPFHPQPHLPHLHPQQPHPSLTLSLIPTSLLTPPCPLTLITPFLLLTLNVALTTPPFCLRNRLHAMILFLKDLIHFSIIMVHFCVPDTIETLM